MGHKLALRVSLLGDLAQVVRRRAVLGLDMPGGCELLAGLVQPVLAEKYDAKIDMAQHAVPAEGHFGLLGISERANRLRGTVTFVSTPGAGTNVRVMIPMDPPPDASMVANSAAEKLS